MNIIRRTIVVVSPLLLFAPSTSSFSLLTGIVHSNCSNDLAKQVTNKNTHNNNGASSSLLRIQTTATESASALRMSTSCSEDKLDVEAIGKYTLSAGVEIALLTVFLRLVDFGMSPARGMMELPLPVITVLFYVLSLKSRVFSPLNNQRPNLSKDKGKGAASKGFGDRIMPSWTPPGIFFPILWILINAPLRAYATTLVYAANGHVLCDPTIVCLMWHLTCGDVWNTINNTERRLGASVAGVGTVWLSVWYAIYRYYLIDPLAGKLLGLTGIWITIAAALVANTWSLNPRKDGTLDPLFPIKGEGEGTKTSFFFEENNDN